MLTAILIWILTAVPAPVEVSEWIQPETAPLRCLGYRELRVAGLSSEDAVRWIVQQGRCDDLSASLYRGNRR